MAVRYPEDKGYPYYAHLDEEEMDVFIAALAYLLIEHTDMDREDIYSLLFRGGRQITWH